MNVNCYNIVYFSVKSFYPHFRSFETYSCIISYCTAFYLSTFSHDAARILASPESIAGGAPNFKTGEFRNANAHFFGSNRLGCFGNMESLSDVRV